MIMCMCLQPSIKLKDGCPLFMYGLFESYRFVCFMYLEYNKQLQEAKSITGILLIMFL